MERDKIKMVVMGLSYNQIHDGAYALILAEANGPYRIPIVIGSAEAQAIAVVMEHVTPPRPLTHDLFTSLGHAFGLRLLNVFIHSFEEGVFMASMTFENVAGEIISLDSRTSDAIAIAMRMNAPIYTTRHILESTGFILEKKGPGKGVASGQNSEGLKVEIEWDEKGDNNLEEEILGTATQRYDDMELEELEMLMQEAVEDEDYELAKELKTKIEEKKNANN